MDFWSVRAVARYLAVHALRNHLIHHNTSCLLLSTYRDVICDSLNLLACLYLLICNILFCRHTSSDYDILIVWQQDLYFWYKSVNLKLPLFVSQGNCVAGDGSNIFSWWHSGIAVLHVHPKFSYFGNEQHRHGRKASCALTKLKTNIDGHTNVIWASMHNPCLLKMLHWS